LCLLSSSTRTERVFVLSPRMHRVSATAMKVKCLQARVGHGTQCMQVTWSLHNLDPQILKSPCQTICTYLSLGDQTSIVQGVPRYNKALNYTKISYTH
jgi:hypothetical protein